MENEIPKGTTNQPLLQFIPDAAVFTNTSFIITACNKMAATLFNFRQHDVLGFDISFLTPVTSAINTQQVSLKNNVFKQGIIAQMNKAGKKMLVHITRHAIDPESINGGFLFIYKLIDQDLQIDAPPSISNGPQTEATSSLFEKSEEQYQWPAEQPGDAIIIFNSTYQCLDANTNACHLTGYNRQDLIHVNLLDLIHSDELNKSVPEKTILGSVEKVMWERKMSRKDGSTYYAEFTFQLMSDDRILSIVHDITQRKKTELALQQSEERHRLLSDHLLNIRETERTNIAREIHDELGQQLTSLKMDMSWLRQKLQKYEDATVLQKTSDTLQLLNETIKTVRRIATELRPSMLDDLGLIEAMEWQSKEFEKRSGIKITFEPAMPHLSIGNSMATSLFRIYQEALTNIGRHAAAKNIYSKLQLENDKIILLIKDDGIGFDMQTLGVKKTLGLLGMKERTLMMGGRFEINSKAGAGTTIVITTFLQSEDTTKSQTE